MTKEAEAARAGTGRKYWHKKNLVGLFLFWFICSIGLALYTFVTDASSAMSTPRIGASATRSTTFWTLVACMAAVLAGSVVWLACASLFAKRDSTLDEIRDTLPSYAPPRDDHFETQTADDPLGQDHNTGTLNPGE